MQENPFPDYRVINNFLLSVIVVVLIIILCAISKMQNRDRYSFTVYNQANEVYVFDKYTGKLFITSPEIIGDYSDEMWAELNPTAKGKTMSFKEFLFNKANRELRKRFVEEKRQMEMPQQNAENGKEQILNNK
ncbi:MAG: hypothetical protein KJ893_00490 [Candidatus Omnitrophica bacterium]|nr:hypothetical protein [Candidatus Omnitrophota bacterium]MBU4479324.1 hypothetical protein [Candidatus Omnitrophota bacterium]MCG2704236.1 hypothetical protein [Candidatus Omnitrophota bacterium]